MTVRDHVYDAIKDRFFAGGLTYSGHPLACASGVASVGIFREEGVVENAAAQGEYLRGALADLAAGTRRSARSAAWASSGASNSFGTGRRASRSFRSTRAARRRSR